MPGGRPKKYSTTEAKAAAKREHNHKEYLRRRNRGIQLKTRPDFIHYTAVPPGVPSATPSNLGLRVSADLPIPPDPFIQPDEDEQDAIHLLSPLAPLPEEEDVAEDNVEATRAISQLKASSKQHSTERNAYERLVQQKISETDAKAAETLLEMKTGVLQPHVSADKTSEHPAQVQRLAGSKCELSRSTVSKDLPHLSIASNVRKPVVAEKSPATNTCHIGYESTGTFEEPTINLAEALGNSQVLNQCSSISSARPLRRSSRCRTRIHGTTPPPSSSNPSTTPLAQASNSNKNPWQAVQAPAAAERTPTAALPAETTPGAGSPVTPPTEQTAYKLAKQLRKFQGCTHNEHMEEERKHQKHHEQPDVHSLCSDLTEITGLISGVHRGGRPLPDVLSNPKLMKRCALPEGLDLKAAFEGTSPAAYPEDVDTPNEKLPRSLCLEQHYRSSKKRRTPHVRFDVDSVCVFPSSLGFAQKGIYWYPRAHVTFNLKADIHFGLPVSAYNDHGNLTTTNLPLHKIPHYCFGTVAGSIRSLLVFVFFPELRLRSEYKHSTYLSKQDQQLWLDAVLLPAISETVNDSTIMSYLPASEDNASFFVTAVGKETLKKKQSSREQHLAYTLQHQYLDQLWTNVLERITNNPGLGRFSNATLFVHAKNTKLAHMTNNLATTYENWQKVWAEVADPQFYSRDRTFVDIAKTVTSEDFALPYDSVPEDFEAETYLWKRCCLESYVRTRVKLLEDGKRERGSPRVTVYPWATMRDTIGQTLSTAPRGQENLDGLVYSQFYATIKSPFDVSKVYVFDNQAIENLALDPGYVRSLQQQGGGATFNEKKCQESYTHSKQRVGSSLRDNQRQSYGIREEHRLSLTMMDEICELWQQWDLDDENGIDNVHSPLPYYIVPSQELFGFLRAQINKYCFLFEHTLGLTARVYSLPETMAMVVALRALRFCYGSNMLVRESLLYKDRWEQKRGQDIIVKEGLGMQETMASCGFGWFLPKFSWATRRLAQPHGDNILVGNLLMHAEYKRRWRAVKDLKDVFTRFSQATKWYTQYRVQQRPQLLQRWLEYLHALNLQQFDADVWSAMLTAHKTHPELSPAALEIDGHITFSHQGMRKMFLKEGVVAPPHIVTGNQMRITTAEKLMNFLFLWDDGQERKGWAGLPYRYVLQQSFDFIQNELGHGAASRWLDEYFYLICLTHWMLPYPSSNALIKSTKENSLKGQTGRMMWFSSVFAHPMFVTLWCKDNKTPLNPGWVHQLPKKPLIPIKPSTVVYRLVRRAHQSLERNCALVEAWDAPTLIKECRKQGIPMFGQDKTEEYWVAGRVGASKKGNLAIWEEGKPPRLSMVEKIQDKTIDELEAMMVEFTQEQEIVAGEEVIQVGAIAVKSVRPLRRSLCIADFFRQAREQQSENDSVFVPSTASNV